jgi:hypothetical protein
MLLSGLSSCLFVSLLCYISSIPPDSYCHSPGLLLSFLCSAPVTLLLYFFHSSGQLLSFLWSLTVIPLFCSCHSCNLFLSFLGYISAIPLATSCHYSGLFQSNKPIMEKRRRARINHCLNELKNLILDAMNKDVSQSQNRQTVAQMKVHIAVD